jgi:hypothetical protein
VLSEERKNENERWYLVVVDRVVLRMGLSLKVGCSKVGLPHVRLKFSLAPPGPFKFSKPLVSAPSREFVPYSPLTVPFTQELLHHSIVSTWLVRPLLPPFPNRK